MCSPNVCKDVFNLNVLIFSITSLLSIITVYSWTNFMCYMKGHNIVIKKEVAVQRRVMA